MAMNKAKEVEMRKIRLKFHMSSIELFAAIAMGSFVLAIVIPQFGFLSQDDKLIGLYGFTSIGVLILAGTLRKAGRAKEEYHEILKLNDLNKSDIAKLEMKWWEF